MSATETFRPYTLAEHPDFTPEEVGRRFLKLIDSLKSFDELSSEHIRRVMQLPMANPPSDTDDGFLTMTLPESGWQYSFSYSIDAKFPRYTNAKFEFTNKKDDRADMGLVCGLDFNAYVAALKHMGFKEEHPTYDELGRLVDLFYSRGDVSIRILQERQADAPDEKLHHACVKIISVHRAGS